MGNMHVVYIHIVSFTLHPDQPAVVSLQRMYEYNITNATKKYPVSFENRIKYVSLSPKRDHNSAMCSTPNSHEQKNWTYL